MTPQAALAAAIAIAGSQAKLAAICGLSQPSVHKWVRGQKRLPAEHVLAVEAATGVSRFDLRPDIYPREDATNPPSTGDGTAPPATPTPAGGADRSALQGVRA